MQTDALLALAAEVLALDAQATKGPGPLWPARRSEVGEHS